MHTGSHNCCVCFHVLALNADPKTVLNSWQTCCLKYRTFVWKLHCKQQHYQLTMKLFFWFFSLHSSKLFFQSQAWFSLSFLGVKHVTIYTTMKCKIPQAFLSTTGSAIMLDSFFFYRLLFLRNTVNFLSLGIWIISGRWSFFFASKSAKEF